LYTYIKYDTIIVNNQEVYTVRIIKKNQTIEIVNTSIQLEKDLVEELDNLSKKFNTSRQKIINMLLRHVINDPDYTVELK
jgi:hypothetical protein